MKNVALSIALILAIAGAGAALFKDQLTGKNGSADTAGNIAEAPQEDAAETTAVTTAALISGGTASDAATADTAWAETTAPLAETTLSAVWTETTAGLTVPVTESAAPAETTSPAGAWNTIAEKYAPLGLTLDENALLALDDCFSAQVRYYEDIYKPLHAENGSNVPVSVTASAASRLDALANVSPAAYVLNSHRSAIRSNPVILMKKLCRGQFTGEEKAVRYQSSLAGTAPSPVAYTGSPTEFIRNFLSTTLGAGDYYIGYSDSDGLYYVYLLDAGSDLNASSLYFKFENGVLTAAGADCAAHSGTELTRTYANCGGEMTSVGAAGNETVYFSNLSASLYALIGSAPEGLLPANPSVSCETSCTRDLADNGGAAVKGMYNSCWFTLR